MSTDLPTPKRANNPERPAQNKLDNEDRVLANRQLVYKTECTGLHEPKG